MKSYLGSYKLHKKRGFGIVVVLTFAAILAVFTAAIGAQTASNLHTVERQGQTDEAHYAALTGIHVTMGYLFQPPGPPFYENHAEWLEKDRSVRFRVGPQILVAAHLYHNIQGFEGCKPEADDGTKIPPDHFYITSVGEVNAVYGENGELTGGVRVRQNTMGALIAPDFPIMPYAMFGYDKVYVNGVVDHFDSKDADPSSGYPPVILRVGRGGELEASSSTDPMECVCPDASVATAASGADAIELDDNARVDGHAVLGYGSNSLHNLADEYPLATPPQVEPDPIPAFGPPYVWAGGGNNERLNGVVSRLATKRERREISLPSDVEPLGSNPVVAYTQTVTGGKRYHVAGNLTVSSGGGFVVDQDDVDNPKDVVIFVDGNITFDGVTNINRSAPPGQLKFYSLASTAPTTSFRMVNGSKAHCLVAGNQLEAIIDNGSELWGAVMGNQVRLESGTIHYDTRLRDPITVASAYGFSILSNSSLPQAVVTSAILAPPGGAPGTSATGGTTGGGIGVTGTGGGTTAGTTGGGTTGGTTTGGGCGCGGGSMEMMAK